MNMDQMGWGNEMSGRILSGILRRSSFVFEPVVSDERISTGENECSDRGLSLSVLSLHQAQTPTAVETPSAPMAAYPCFDVHIPFLGWSATLEEMRLVNMATFRARERVRRRESMDKRNQNSSKGNALYLVQRPMANADHTCTVRVRVACHSSFYSTTTSHSWQLLPPTIPYALL